MGAPRMIRQRLFTLLTCVDGITKETTSYQQKELGFRHLKRVEQHITIAPSLTAIGSKLQIKSICKALIAPLVSCAVQGAAYDAIGPVADLTSVKQAYNT